MTAFCSYQSDEGDVVLLLEPIDWEFSRILEAEGIEQAARWIVTRFELGGGDRREHADKAVEPAIARDERG